MTIGHLYLPALRRLEENRATLLVSPSDGLQAARPRQPLVPFIFPRSRLILFLSRGVTSSLPFRLRPEVVPMKGSLLPSFVPIPTLVFPANPLRNRVTSFPLFAHAEALGEWVNAGSPQNSFVPLTAPQNREPIL